MNILVTGANGFLGQHLISHFSTLKHDVIAAGRGDSRIPEKIPVQFHSLDLTDSAAVEDLIKIIKPQVIIHTAAISKPDECEKNKEACLQNNVEATRHLLDAFKLAGSGNSLFIYLSTDFVFGENGPHSEEDMAGPLNFYGESKLMAEELVINSGLKYAVVRPVFIYGPVWQGLRPSFLHWVKNNLEQSKKIKVVSDQLRTPTFVFDICKGIENIITQDKTGIYHLAGKDILSPYQMAVITARVLALDDGLIENVTSETFPEPVQRAKHSGLKILKAQTELGYAPVSFEDGVKYSFA